MTKAAKPPKRPKTAPDFIIPDALVWYESRPGKKYPATVDGHPWEMNPGQWVVRLRNLPASYAKETSRQATHVPCAATWCVTPRVVSA